MQRIVRGPPQRFRSYHQQGTPVRKHFHHLPPLDLTKTLVMILCTCNQIRAWTEKQNKE